MASKKISILLADVDGTLVDSQKRITERAKAAIQKLNAAGIKFAVTSGRPPRGMKMIVEEINLSTPMAAFNGGMLVEPGTMKVLIQQTLDAEQKKYELGASTIYNVILTQRDLLQAQSNEVAALSAYSRARVELERSAQQKSVRLRLCMQ